MNQINFDNAYFIKLGRQGEWESSSIEENKARIGWNSQTLDDINQKQWANIGKQLTKQFEKNGTYNKGAVTRDLKALKNFSESTSNDVWITFHESRLWWCQLQGNVKRDDVSKYRDILGCWSDQDINGNSLLANQISGRLSKIQRFQGTVCKVKEKKDLHRLLNNLPSKESQVIEESKDNLINSIVPGLKRLHWRDFETLVDLLFTNSGWHRLSVVGKAMKYSDIECEEPITKELYQIQVKSTADIADLRHYAKEFSPKGFRKLYFVVHTPSKDLNDYKQEDENVELILPKRLAEMVVDLGLLNWLLQKIK